MNNPYDLILNYFKSARIQYASQFLPYFVGSIGNHIFNYTNIRRRILHKAKDIPEMRVHIMFIAPSAVMKGTIIKRLIHKDGILAPLGTLRPPDMENIPLTITTGDREEPINYDTALIDQFTEAALIGTIRGEKRTYGLAWLYQYGIIGTDEASAIFGVASQDHSKTLSEQLLQVLDKGYVSKALSYGTLEYRTYTTIWLGTQFANFDLTQGFGRRFNIFYFAPSLEQYDDILKASRSNYNIRYNSKEVEDIRASIREIKYRLNDDLEEVKMGYLDIKEVDSYARHWEQEIAERILLGIKIMKGDFTNILKVEPSEEDIELLKHLWRQRNNIMKYGKLLILLHAIPMNDSIDLSTLSTIMAKSGYQHDQTLWMISKAVSRHLIVRYGRDSYRRIVEL